MIYANLDGNEFRIYSIKKKKIYRYIQQEEND